MPSQWTKCKKARDFYNCMKYNSSKIQNWHSALLLAAQVGKMKRFLCSDWPPSGQDGRILSTCSLLILLLLLLFVWTPTLSRSMKYITGVISYPDLRWYGEKRERIWRHLRMKTTSQSVRQCWPLAKIYPKGMYPKCFVLIIPLFIVRCLKLQSPLSKARNRKLHLKMWMAIKWLAIWRRIHQVRQTILIFRISIHFHTELSSVIVGLAKSWF